MPKGKGGMGFRDLQSFNLAMLAKQVWGLLSEPDSLCARVLRARYYPDGKLLKARMRSGSSYTWQSILAGLDCFKQGIFGGLEMVLKLIFGRIIGSLGAII